MRTILIKPNKNGLKLHLYKCYDNTFIVLKTWIVHFYQMLMHLVLTISIHDSFYKYGGHFILNNKAILNVIVYVL